LAVVFVRYALIVTGTFDGGITKLGTLQFFFIISFIFNNLEVLYYIILLIGKKFPIVQRDLSKSRGISRTLVKSRKLS